MALIFSQDRVGLDGRIFKLYKLETMRDGVVTRKWLRKSGLDELPQLWNVIKGDMRIFGPRPEIPHIHENCSRVLGEVWDARLRVKPGLLSLASVKLAEARTELRYSQDVMAHKAIIDNTMIDDMGWRVRLAILLQLPSALLRGQHT